MNTDNNNIKLSPAEKHYQAVKKAVSKYQKDPNNKEKNHEKCKKYNDKIKSDPERYKEFLEKKRQYYINVVKPKNEALKNNKKHFEELKKIMEDQEINIITINN